MPIEPRPPVTVSDELLSRLQERKESNDTPRRLAAAEGAMTPALVADLTRRLGQVVNESASVRSKLPKLYAILDVASEARAPYVACAEGCSACCHMQVEMTGLEAERISQFTGRSAVKLAPGRHTTPIHELGRPDTPCTFLVDNRCSIYDVRPFTCRHLAVFDVDALTCSFENMELERRLDPRRLLVPQADLPPIVQAFATISGRSNATLADIRQFFPRETA